MKKSYVEKAVVLKSLALSLSNTSEFLIEEKRFLPDISYAFLQYLIACFLIAVRQNVTNLESSVVVQELELAIYLALYGVYGV